MQCPNCHVALVMSDRQGVEIDYCPQCRGVWLDRGELDKIIERSDAPPQHNERERHQEDHHQRHDDDDDHRERHDDDHHDSHHGKRRKKESFLGDMFDF